MVVAVMLVWAAPAAWAGAKRPALGLVLSGGGAKGLAHIGVLKVLEEADLRPDMIAGTSMGGIVGALYAVGYNAREIEAVVLHQDWEALLADRIPREALSFEDKQEDGKYLAVFPISRGKLSLPTGLVSGQNITTLMTRLFFPARDVTDFRRLPIPFFCMATDIESGQPVLMDRGYLPEVVRATMSIPSMFTPVELDGKLLVDGGVLCNLPVEHLRERGADTIIAVDVNFQLSGREQLDSLAKILNQSVMIYTLEACKRQAAMAKIRIEPPLVEFNLMDFDQARAIIDRGEAEARRHWKELTDLAASLGRTPGKPQPQSRPDPGTTVVHVTEIRVEGLREVSREFVNRQLGLDAPSRLSCLEIERAVNRLYGSKYFQSVTYAFQPADGGEILRIQVKEDADSFFRFGIHYDTELYAMLLMEASFRNLLSRGSDLRLDAALGKLSAFDASYFFQPGWQRGLGIGVGINYQNGGMALYHVGKVEAYEDKTYWKTDLLARGTIWDAVALGAGVEKEFMLANSTQTVDGEDDDYVESLNYVAFLKIDTLDRSFYPRSGTRTELTVKYVTDDGGIRLQDDWMHYALMQWNARHVLPLTRRLSLAGSLYGGASIGESGNPAQWFFLGGMTGFQRNQLPFLGLRNIESAGPDIWVAQIGLQAEPWDDKFVILRANAGRTAYDVKDLFQRDETLSDLFVGYGLTVGALTVVGPVEGTVMADDRGRVSGFVSIGRPF